MLGMSLNYAKCGKVTLAGKKGNSQVREQERVDVARISENQVVAELLPTQSYRYLGVNQNVARIEDGN